MRLYVTRNGSWAGTQADAKALAASERSVWREEEVPTSKAELLAFLNRLHVGREGTGEAPQAPPEVVEAPKAPVAPAAPSAADRVAEECDIEEAIGRADLPRTIRLAEHVHWRLKEHLEEARLYLT